MTCPYLGLLGESRCSGRSAGEKRKQQIESLSVAHFSCSMLSDFIRFPAMSQLQYVNVCYVYTRKVPEDIETLEAIIESPTSICSLDVGVSLCIASSRLLFFFMGL